MQKGKHPHSTRVLASIMPYIKENLKQRGIFLFVYFIPLTELSVVFFSCCQLLLCLCCDSVI